MTRVLINFEVVWERQGRTNFDLFFRLFRFALPSSLSLFLSLSFMSLQISIIPLSLPFRSFCHISIFSVKEARAGQEYKFYFESSGFVFRDRWVREIENVRGKRKRIFSRYSFSKSYNLVALFIYGYYNVLVQLFLVRVLVR